MRCSRTGCLDRTADRSGRAGPCGTTCCTIHQDGAETPPASALPEAAPAIWRPLTTNVVIQAVRARPLLAVILLNRPERGWIHSETLCHVDRLLWCVGNVCAGHQGRPHHCLGLACHHRLAWFDMAADPC